MITANELRLGNYLKTNQSELPPKVMVTQVYMDGFTVDYHYPGSWCEPIPLTPEILEKAGFENFYNSDFTKKWEHKQNCFLEVSFINGGVRSFRFGGTHLRHIDYLHQLQNLYFYLTGTELNIQL